MGVETEVSEASADGSKSMGPPARVYVSYFNEEAHRGKVREFCDRLRQMGVDAQVDLYVSAPPVGWPRWVEQQLIEADFILLVCTEKYCKEYLAPSRGTQRYAWEGQIMRQLLVESQVSYARFIPVVLDDATKVDIPVPFGNFTKYRMEADYEALYARLTGQEPPPPQLGMVQRLAPVEAKQEVSAGAPEKLDWASWLQLSAREFVRVARRRRGQLFAFVAATVAVVSLVRAEWIRVLPFSFAVGEPTRLDRCLATGNRLGLPYVLESVAMLWSFHDEGAARAIAVRTSYVIRPLRDLGADDEDAFVETYGYDGVGFEHWYGTEEEVFTSQAGTSYEARLRSGAGDSYTLVTGANLSYPLPRPSGRHGFRSNVVLAANEEMWRYPNSTDVICSLSMVVGSDTTPIRPAGEGAGRDDGEGAIWSPLFVNGGDAGATSSAGTLSARWYDLMPGDDVGIYFSW